MHFVRAAATEFPDGRRVADLLVAVAGGQLALAAEILVSWTDEDFR